MKLLISSISLILAYLTSANEKFSLVSSSINRSLTYALSFAIDSSLTSVLVVGILETGLRGEAVSYSYLLIVCCICCLGGSTLLT